MSGAAVLAGYGADRAFGDPRRGHPVALFGRLAGRAEARLYRPSRAAGVLYAAGLVALPALLGRLAERRAGARVRGLVLAASLWAALGGRSLGAAARTVAAHVAAGELPAARVAVRALVGRDPEAMGADELCRAAVESVAENTVDAVVSPLLWAAVGGSAGVLAHRAANTLDAMVGYRDERYGAFGWAAARLDDALNWPGARATAGAAVLLAPAVGGSPAAAWRILRRDGAAHPSPNGGRAEAAFAGALGVRLGGRNAYGGRIEARTELGDGARPAPGDVERAVRLAALVGGTAAIAAAGLRRRLAR